MTENPLSPQIRSSRSVREFRIDFLLEEEFACDLGFAKKFAARCGLLEDISAVLQVACSVSDRHGEADVVALLQAGCGDSASKRVALLIEDKITAEPQPDQAKRYRQRGEEGRGELWDDYRTVLVSPSTYIGEKDGFDCAIPLEELMDWLSASDPSRAEFRSRKLKEAIEKKNATGVQIVDQAVTALRANYYAYLLEFNQRHGTDFSIPIPKPVYRGELWFNISSKTLPPWAKMRHKARTSMKAATGLMELAFPDTSATQLMDGLSSRLESGMRIVANGTYGQHTAIEIEVPELWESAPFDEESAKLELALSAGERLWRWLQANAALVEPLVKSSKAVNAA